MTKAQETKVNRILRALQDAPEVHIDGKPVNMCDVHSDIEHDGENELVSIYWDDTPGDEFCTKLTEAGLAKATINDNKIVANDYEGDRTVITLFQTVPFNVR